MNSVNTNVGAMVALQSLNQTNSDLATVQSRVNTGRKINNAKDNAAIWAIAQGQRGEVASYNAVKESLSRGQSAIDVSLSAGEAIADKLNRMKELALSASDANLNQASRDAMQEEYRAAASEIRKYVQNASFNGVNLLDGSANYGYRALANSKGTTTVDVAKEDILFRSTAGTAGKLAGTTAGSTFTQASSFTIRFDGAATGGTKVDVAAGDGVSAVARKINNAVGKNVATVNNSGFLEIASPNYSSTTPAVTSNVAIVTGGTDSSGDITSAATATTFLGFAAMTGTAGTAATGGRTSGGLEVTGNETFAAATDYTALLKQLDDSIANVSKAIGRLGSGGKTMESTLSFVSKLQDTLEAGIGALVDADLAKESARLQALQTKQQLGVQALSIANQSTGILLGLFR